MYSKTVSYFLPKRLKKTIPLRASHTFTAQVMEYPSQSGFKKNNLLDLSPSLSYKLYCNGNLKCTESLHLTAVRALWTSCRQSALWSLEKRNGPRLPACVLFRILWGETEKLTLAMQTLIKKIIGFKFSLFEDYVDLVYGLREFFKEPSVVYLTFETQIIPIRQHEKHI